MPSTIIENVTPTVSNTVKTSALKSLFYKVKGAPIKSAAVVLGTVAVVTGAVMLVKKLRTPSDEVVQEASTNDGDVIDAVFEDLTATSTETV